MLSSTSTPVVRATLPVVAEHLDAIAAEFYRTMLGENPELQNIFTRSAQVTGVQRRALAGSVAAFAASLLGEGPPMGPVLERVAHRHASLGIRPEQYPIVGRYLLGAVATVLGDAVTPAVAAAWDEVYWLMACRLVGLEARLYASKDVDPDTSWREFVVTGRHDEAVDTVSFSLAPENGAPAPGYRPGQYVSIRVTLPDGGRQIRQYSLSKAPGGTSLRITVRRVPGGLVSGFLHDHLRTGDRLPVSPPFGNLAPEPAESPLLLVSAGVGITPMAAVIDHLAGSQPARPVVAVHADRAPDRHPLLEEVLHNGSRLASFEHQVWYETPAGPAPDNTDVRTGLVDPHEIPLYPGAEAYLCGPIPFMRDVRAGLLSRGLPENDIRYEVFGSDDWLAPR